MRTYVVANSVGEIVRTVRCPVEQAAGQAQSGETLIEAPAETSHLTHYITSGGTVAEYTPEQFKRKSVRPPYAHKWSNASMQWIDPRTAEVRLADLAAHVRATRDKLLTACDWTQVSDAPLTEIERETWKGYRQKLRAVPQQKTFPAAVAWPVSPW